MGLCLRTWHSLKTQARGQSQAHADRCVVAVLQPLTVLQTAGQCSDSPPSGQATQGQPVPTRTPPVAPVPPGWQQAAWHGLHTGGRACTRGTASGHSPSSSLLGGKPVQVSQAHEHRQGADMLPAWQLVLRTGPRSRPFTPF